MAVGLSAIQKEQTGMMSRILKNLGKIKEDYLVF